MVLFPLLDNLNDTEKSKYITDFNNYRREGKPIFLFLYWVGCTPCELAKAAWKNIPTELTNNDDIVVVAINKDLFGDLENIGTSPLGFPDFRYIKGETIEEYNGPKTTDGFSNWIRSKTGTMTGGKRRHVRRRTKKRSKKRGKWSKKYKKSINCKRPRGYSQKQYCKYGKKI